MSNLAELVNHVVMKDGLKIPESAVLDRLFTLEQFQPSFERLGIHHERYPEGGRILTYIIALKEYEEGLNDGLKQVRLGKRETVESYLSQSGKSSSDFYVQGFGVGYVIKVTIENAERGKNSAVAASYTGLAEQLNKWTSLLIKELNVLAEAKDSPYRFLLQQIYFENGKRVPEVSEYKAIADSIALLLEKCGDFSRDLLEGRISHKTITELERADVLEANIKVGLFYLLNGKPYEAEAKLRDAVNQSSKGDPLAALSRISSNILIAQRLVEPAYNAIKLAKRFEPNSAMAGR